MAVKLPTGPEPASVDVEYLDSADLQPVSEPRTAAQVQPGCMLFLPGTCSKQQAQLSRTDNAHALRTGVHDSQACETGLRSKVWTDAIAALNTLRALVVHHPDVVRPSLCVQPFPLVLTGCTRLCRNRLS